MSIRLRLTALYGGLFVAVGALLVAITYGLFASRLQAARPRPPDLGRLPVLPEGLGDPRRVLDEALARQRDEALDQLLTQSIVALAIVSVIAVVLGWMVAGHALRPLREITATARRLSTDNLDERIGLGGPRDEIKELADTFDAMLARIAAAFEAQRRFVANASHELRTPLTVQRAAVDVALADPEPSLRSLTAMAVRIRAATQRHERLIASLLTLARSERGVEHYEDVDFTETVQTVLVGTNTRDLKVVPRLRPAHVRGDPALLERLAVNLLDNAVRHNTPDGWIEVRVRSEGGVVTLHVANSGPAVPAEEAEALFEPFRRRSAGGHGLGLSIVAAIAAAHGGTHAAFARPEGGLEVTVSLPARVPCRATAAAPVPVRSRSG
ncbi:sensor histidine kinase [Actinomadura rudentiformis]|uniref:histidine kinase n=1 Tax=Actinomadura rudentiformis TaxID=359158 RepID=A0A6H9YP29_9ACTN|nr:ATP-binding protein [Actinomadura rudentiformis]KAB2342489.1 HAMP domain-containing protein [Actinomadura rudentiformis]